MPGRDPQKTVVGGCPNCGPSHIETLLEGWTTFFMVEWPNESCAHWVGQCRQCRVFLEAYVEDEERTDTLEWTLMDDERIDFILGPREPMDET